MLQTNQNAPLLRLKYQKPFYPLSNKCFPLCIMAISAFFYFYQFILRVFPSTITNELMQDFTLGAYPLGIIISFYYYGYTIMQIPVGMILDRLGIRHSLIIGTLSCALGTFLFIHSNNYILLSFARFLMGVGSAFAFLSCIKTSNVLFSKEHLGILIGLSVMVGMIGAVGGYYPFASATSQIGWRSTLSIVCAIGLILILLVSVFVHDDQSSSFQMSEKAHDHSLLHHMKLILKNPQTWIFGIYGGLMYMVLSTFSDLWGTTYISYAYTVNAPLAASSVSCIYLGMTVGAPLLPFLVKRLQSYTIVMRVGAFVSIFTFSIVLYLPSYIPFSLTYYLFFITGIAMCALIFTFSSINHINPTSISGTASGIQNMMCMLSGVICQPFVGFLLDLQWDGTLHAGIPHYSLGSYFIALSILPLGLILAFSLSFFMEETYASSIRL